MAEQEELRLTVTIDDRASAQLQGLRGQLNAMGGGAQAAGMERVRRQSAEVGQGFAGLSRELSTFATRAGVIGGVVGAVTGKLLELGGQFIQRATDIRGYSDAILTLQKNAALGGTTAAQFQANMNTIRESTGVSAEEAAGQLTKFGEAWVDLQRQKSHVRDSLTKDLSGRDLANMQSYLTQAMRSDVNTAFNLAQDYAKRIKQYWIDHGDPTRGELVSRDFLARQGLKPTEARLAPVSPEDQARAEARNSAAKTYRDLSEQTATFWDQLTTSATSLALQILPINEGMQKARDLTKSAAEHSKTWEDHIREAGGLLNALKGVKLPTWLGGEPEPDTRPRAAPGERPTPRDLEERDRAFREAEAEKAASAARDAAARASGGRGPSAPVTRTGPPPSRFPQRLPPPTEQAAPDAAAIDVDAEAAAKAEAERLEARRQSELLRRRGGRPSIFEQPPTTATPSAPAISPRRVAPSAPVARPPGFSESRVPAAAQQFSDPEISTAPPPRGVVPGATLAPPSAMTPTQPIIVSPAPPAPIIIPAAPSAPWSIPQPRRFPALQDDRPAAPSAFDGGRLSLMGGEAMDQGQAAQAFDAKAIDRAAGRDISVTGSGKISVDVRAPPGTRVNAQGEGLFKKTEIFRQSQMVPAEYGPTAATGIGAAEGPL